MRLQPYPIATNQTRGIAHADRQRYVWVALLALLLTLTSGQTSQRLQTSQYQQVDQAARVEAALARAPLMFIPNVGQFEPTARYELFNGTTLLTLAEDALWLTIRDHLPTSSSDSKLLDAAPTRAVRLKLSFAGANRHPRIEPLKRLDTQVSYFTGADARAWHTDIPTWSGVRYHEIYPGIDLELDGAQGHLAMRVIARQITDAHLVRLRVDGADTITLAQHGLRLTTELGTFALPLLQLVDTDGTTPTFAAMQPSLHGSEIVNPFGTAAPPDPITSPQAAGDLIYSTFFGGSKEDQGGPIAVDTANAAYVAGFTTSDNFPATPGAVNIGPSGYNGTIVKIKPDGSGLEYAAIVGGDGIEYTTGIAVDGTGAAYIAGYTASTDFPTTSGAYDPTGTGVDKLHRDSFLLKLNPSGSNFVYSTYLGGSGDERATKLAIDSNGAAYLTGLTPSADFPTTVGAYDRIHNGGDDVYVVKLNSDGSNLLYSTFLGGSGNEKGNGIAIDSSGAANVAGWSTSANFPTTAAYDPSANGIEDAFVAKLSPTGAGLIYSTMLGGTGNDRALSIALDGNGAAYIAGYTFSTDFPTTSGAFERIQQGDKDAFAAKLSASGVNLMYSTFLGGGGEDESRAIAVNTLGEAFLTGYTGSSNFPTNIKGYDTSFNGVNDAFVVKLLASGAGLSYGSYLGGSQLDTGDGIALDSTDIVYLSGEVGSSDFPTTPGAYRTTFNGGSSDAYAAKLRVGGIPPQVYTISGHVRDSVGTPVPGVTISIGDPTTVTGADGSYQIHDLGAGSYTIIPNKADYQFQPARRDVQLSADLANQDFTVNKILFQVSGRVIDNDSGVGLAGVTISAGGDNTTTTNSTGDYSLPLEANTYTLTPARQGYTFVPPSRAITVAAANLAIEQFTGIPIPVPPQKPIYLSLMTRIAPVGCDDYEPNNNRRSNPTTITLGQTIVAKICQNEGIVQPVKPLYEDNYVLTTEQSSPLLVRLTLPTTLLKHVALAVYNVEALDLPINRCYIDKVNANSSPTLRCAIPDAGTYIVRIYSADQTTDNTHTYELQVTQ